MGHYNSGSTGKGGDHYAEAQKEGYAHSFVFAEEFPHPAY